MYRSIRRHPALTAWIAAALLFALLIVTVFWITGQTDNGMLCDRSYFGDDRPTACHVYDAPLWIFLAAAAMTIVAMALSVGVVVRRQTQRP